MCARQAKGASPTACARQAKGTTLTVRDGQTSPANHAARLTMAPFFMINVNCCP
jgi:hypothetical protein